MRIGVLSDTHQTRVTPGVVALVDDFLLDCDRIIHLGDFTGAEVYHYLRGHLRDKFEAVCGNMDPPELRGLLPQKKIVKIGEVSLGLVHGWGSPHDLEERVRRLFQGDNVTCILYGHSHIPANELRRGRLFFNPGSAMDRYHIKGNTIGYVTISEGRIEGDIVRVG